MATMGHDGVELRCYGAQLHAQGFDMRVDGAVIDNRAVAPNAGQNLLACKNMLWRAKQEMQQQIFVAR